TLSDEDGDSCPNLLETLKGSNPQSPPGVPGPLGRLDTRDCANTSAPTPQDLVELLDGIGENSDGDGPNGDPYPDAVEDRTGSDPNDPDSTPAEALGGTVQSLRDNAGRGILLEPVYLCAADAQAICPDSAMPASCDPKRYGCVALLTVGGISNDTFALPALVSIDLGGSDRYPAGAAGTHSIILQRQNNTSAVLVENRTAYSLDLDGDDHYGNPGLANTEGADAAGNGVALLLDLAGNDTYVAGAGSQGAATREHGHGFLIDFSGMDRYQAGAGSQGYGAAGRGALLDLEGNDNYTFQAQATTEALAIGHESPLGLLFDRDGTDTYRSVGRPVQSARLSVADPGTVFDSQGSGPGGLFVDAGSARDQYLSRSTTEAMVDVSAIKNDIARGQPRDQAVNVSMQWPWRHGGGYFLDNPHFLHGDIDNDGTLGLAEVLLGSNPTDPADDGGRAARGDCLDGPGPDACLGGSGSVLEARQPADATETFAGVVLPGLRIGGRGPSTYTKALPFHVDLGGNDTYVAADTASSSLAEDPKPTNVLGSSTPGIATAHRGVVLLLDVTALDQAGQPVPGEGNDAYAATCVRTRPGLTPLSQGIFTSLSVACPSLGAANGGIAILADTGGNNTFQTVASTTATVNRDPTGQDGNVGTLSARGLTQGAATAMGVGILATWDASSRFGINVTATLRSTGGGASPPVVQANGMGQGYSSHGIGLLASFGARDDAYSVATRASVILGSNGEGGTLPGSMADLAQGAVDGLGIDFAQLDLQRLVTVGYVLDSFITTREGVLFDGGGANTFRAPHGRSQGHGAGLGGATGLLWSGTGDDFFSLGQPWNDTAQPGGGTPASPSGQGSGSGPLALGTIARAQGLAMGVLVDGGGSDRYLL
ncbi:MAG TPA: hypothetical protein VHI93_07020, partial [Candidatus Thermoplasmatota archaeon]|nr:hypothetical protein [Candidatus Thermoplasmatota archaeon]